VSRNGGLLLSKDPYSIRVFLPLDKSAVWCYTIKTETNDRKSKMLKIANKRVNGWNNRFVNMTKVAQALYTRQRNGFTLDWEEKKFLGDVESLKKLYNPL